MRKDCFKKLICEICKNGVLVENKFLTLNLTKYACKLDKKPNNKENCFYFSCKDVGKNRNCEYCSFGKDE